MNIILKENERIDDLEINNLKIIQNKSGFCFGIDSVLLSDFAKKIKRNSNIIDIGTGTGIISILLSAKVNVNKILAVEIQKDVADMATRSVKMNNLEDKITVINNDIKNLYTQLLPKSYDAIVTNPPYVKNNTGIKNENISQLISRHEVACTLEDIAKISFILLKDKGELYMIHRPDRLIDIIESFRKNKLEIKEMRLIYPKQGEHANLVLIKAVKNAKPFLKIDTPLYVYNKEGKYSDEIKKIYNKI